MSGTRKRGRARTQAWRRMLSHSDEDPMAVVANLFDVAMVFAVTLLLALMTALSVPELLTSPERFTIVKNAGQPDMEVVVKEGVRVDRFKMSEDEIGGTGRRLGVAYMLANGEVVYVPEKEADKDAAGPATHDAPTTEQGSGSR